MLKKIFKGFLYLLIPLSLVGLYFYIFPVYSDFEIPEEYFHTRFHEEWFDSPQNGFHAWKELIEWLEEHEEIIREFDIYYRCYITQDCSFIAPDMTEEEKTEYLELLLTDSEKIETFWVIIRQLISNLEKISSEYDYISTLNYQAWEGDLTLWPEMITTINLRALARWMLFYVDLLPRAEANSFLVSYYRFLSWLSLHLDDSLVSYLSLIDMLETLFNYHETYFVSLSPAFQGLHLRVLQEQETASDMIENGIKVDYNYQRLLFDALENWDISSDENRWFNPISFLFYDYSDSVNILQKKFADALEGDCNLEVGLNGRNYVGRLLLDFTNCNLFTSHFAKQEEILSIRQNTIDLLSQ